MTAERDSIAKLPPDRKRDERRATTPRSSSFPVAACEAQTAECTPRKLEYAGNETQIDVVAGQQAASRSSASRPLQESAAVRRRRRRRQAAGHPRRLAVRAGQIEWLQGRSIAMMTSTGGSARRLRDRSGVEEDHDDPRRPPRREQRDRTTRRSSTSSSSSTDLTHPTELFIANADGTNERKLTSFNDKVNSEVAWADAERVQVQVGRRARGRRLADEAVRLRRRRRSIRSCSTSTAARTRSTTRAGSTNSRASPARACACCSRIRAARAARTPSSPTRAAAIGAARTSTI